MADTKMWRPNNCGFVGWEVPAKCCCFCEHCNDIFWDFTNGPYMFLCDLEKDYDNEKGCDFFEQDADDD